MRGPSTSLRNQYKFRQKSAVAFHPSAHRGSVGGTACRERGPLLTPGRNADCHPPSEWETRRPCTARVPPLRLDHICLSTGSPQVSKAAYVTTIIKDQRRLYISKETRLHPRTKPCLPRKCVARSIVRADREGTTRDAPFAGRGR